MNYLRRGGVALVRKFERLKLQVEKVHGEVPCTYTSFTSEEGVQYFQVDTYGSPDRKIKGKKSQSIQLDEASARELISLLKAELNIS